MAKATFSRKKKPLSLLHTFCKQFGQHCSAVACFLLQMGTSFKPGVRGIFFFFFFLQSQLEVWCAVILSVQTTVVGKGWVCCSASCLIFVYIVFKMQHFEYWCVLVLFYDPLKCLLFVVN